MAIDPRYLDENYDPNAPPTEPYIPEDPYPWLGEPYIFGEEEQPPPLTLLPPPLIENTNDTGNTDDNEDPTLPPGPTAQPTAQSGGTGGTGGFAWPKFNAPSYQAGPAFQAPAKPFEFQPFDYAPFAAPKPGEIFQDPSYQLRRDEGLNAIQNSAAAKGLTRLPQTVKALGGWNQDFASREYGNIFDRAAQSYDRNRGNAFGNWQANRNNAADTYSMNYGVSRDVFDRNYRGGLDTYDRNYSRAKDMFDVNQFQPAKLTFEDMYRRYRDNLNSQTTIAAAGAGG